MAFLPVPISLHANIGVLAQTSFAEYWKIRLLFGRSCEVVRDSKAAFLLGKHLLTVEGGQGASRRPLRPINLRLLVRHPLDDILHEINDRNEDAKETVAPDDPVSKFRVQSKKR